MTKLHGTNETKYHEICPYLDAWQYLASDIEITCNDDDCITNIVLYGSDRDYSIDGNLACEYIENITFIDDYDTLSLSIEYCHYTKHIDIAVNSITEIKEYHAMDE